MFVYVNILASYILTHTTPHFVNATTSPPPVMMDVYPFLKWQLLNGGTDGLIYA